MNSLARCSVFAAAVVSVSAGAEDFDGSKALICAPTEVMDCVAELTDCWSGSPQQAGAPTFLRIDFAKKTVVGPMRTSVIKHVDKTEEQIILQGVELDMGWTVALDKETGTVAITLTDSAGAFVLFGSCTVP